MNDYAIKFEKDKEPPFGPIYSLKSIEWESLKTYIDTNLAIGFFCFLVLFTKALMMFYQKLDKIFWLCVDY